MKERVYLRIAKSGVGFLFHVSKKSNFAPLKTGDNRFYPTVNIALDLEIDDKEFEESRILLEVKIKNARPCAEIKQVTEEESTEEEKPKEEEEKEEEAPAEEGEEREARKPEEKSKEESETGEE